VIGSSLTSRLGADESAVVPPFFGAVGVFDCGTVGSVSSVAEIILYRAVLVDVEDGDGLGFGWAEGRRYPAQNADNGKEENEIG